MRMRFSLRLILLLIVAALALFYLWFVRPKVFAQRFMTAIEEKDLRVLSRFARTPMTGFSRRSFRIQKYGGEGENTSTPMV